MKLLVGLGNPEEKYLKSRHNIGFMVLDEFLKEESGPQTDWKYVRKFDAEVVRINDFLLAKPQTSMNASGFAVAKLARFYRLKPSQIWVVHDDLDLSLGQIKVASGKSSAGHRGVASLIESLGSDAFGRFRLGIGRPKNVTEAGQKRAEITRYVLEGFVGKEAHEAKKMIKKAIGAITLAAKEGIDKAASRYH